MSLSMSADVSPVKAPFPLVQQSWAATYGGGVRHVGVRPTTRNYEERNRDTGDLGGCNTDVRNA